jgi:hypothetical protein
MQVYGKYSQVWQQLRAYLNIARKDIYENVCADLRSNTFTNIYELLTRL